MEADELLGPGIILFAKAVRSNL
ncbi:unnamed protein product, partial [Rotaria sp. Silwood1]